MLKRLSLIASILALFPLKTAKAEDSFYCIQLFSTKEISRREEALFKELRREFEEVRVEKIGKYYTLRIGFWKEIGKARRTLNHLRKMGFRRAFLRKCYYIPKRWVLPKTNRKVSSTYKTSSRKSTKKEEKIALIVEKLLKEEFKKGREKGKVKRITFPESRRKKKREAGVQLSLGSSINRELSKSYTFTQLSFKGVGVKLIKLGEEKKVGISVKELSKELWLKDLVLLKIGILRRENSLESWSPFSVEALSDFVDKKLLLSVSYQAFRNYENQINLRGLFSLRTGLTYYSSSSSGIELFYLYDKFTNGRQLPFSAGSRFNLKGWNDRFSAFASVKGSSYLLSLEGKIKSLDLKIFTDNSLSLPPQSKGGLYFGNWSSFFCFDPMNLTGAQLKLPLENLSFSTSFYWVRDKGKTFLLGTRKLKSKGRFVGTSLFLNYGLTSSGKELNLGGGLFLPGNAFKEKKAKAGGYFDVKVSW